MLIVIGAGALFIVPANWHPFIPENTGHFGEYGWSGILRGAGVIFFAYIGFDAVSTSAQEAKNPQRDMPIGILGIARDLHGALRARVRRDGRPGAVQGDARTRPRRWSSRSRPRPAAPPARRGRARWRSCKILVTVGALAGLSSVMVVMMLAQPRIFLAMSKDGLLPAWAGRLHPRFRTPHVSTIVTGAVVALAAGPDADRHARQPRQHRHADGVRDRLVRRSSCCGARVPISPRPFRMPLVPLLPMLSALVELRADAQPAVRAPWERLILWMAHRRRVLLRLRLPPQPAADRGP